MSRFFSNHLVQGEKKIDRNAEKLSAYIQKGKEGKRGEREREREREREERERETVRKITRTVESTDLARWTPQSYLFWMFTVPFPPSWDIYLLSLIL
jgi:hypothetical protein